ncbi:hypothetical protein BpHYR1_000346 [Brachionus plicatilis]|uniref:Uncharacterized protein n=1 Tax=Brachionus plicatilis TaxID=10195 RepID=A0A3M7SCW8_BRAPC|nr:hypothetical protein BpHYR1_000346 [Brachionus plicatilis]
MGLFVKMGFYHLINKKLTLLSHILTFPVCEQHRRINRNNKESEQNANNSLIRHLLDLCYSLNRKELN